MALLAVFLDLLRVELGTHILLTNWPPNV